MLARHYAQALLEVRADHAADALIGVLKQKDHLALLPQIVSEYEKLVAEKERLEDTRIRVKDTNDLVRLKESIARYEEKLGFTLDGARVVEEEAIVGGFLIEQGAREVDNSYRGRLIELYRKLTAVNV